jgi:hypothetical protein
MAVEVGRRVTGFKKEKAWRVTEESWRKETRSDKIRQGGSVLKPLYVRSSARLWGETIVIDRPKVSFFAS